MNEKRFTLEMQYWKGNPQGRIIFDNLTGQDGMSVEELCNIASGLHSKCEELESVLKVYEDFLGKLEDENKELKAQLYCDDDSVCNICKHQQLIPNKVMQGYYTAKCEKGHKECSKEDLRHCDDFKLKGGV